MWNAKQTPNYPYFALLMLYFRINRKRKLSNDGCATCNHHGLMAEKGWLNLFCQCINRAA